MQLQGKTAIVTGSTQGLGLAIARGLAAQGCNVTLCGLGPRETVEALPAELAKAHGVKAIYAPADVSKPAQIEEMVRETQRRLGPVDIVINNAVTRHISPVEQFAPEKWDYALAVNLSSAFHTARLVLPQMRERNWGRIINVTSVLGTRALPDKIDYVTTKHALIGLTRAIAVETVRTGITCNAILPGWVLTPHSERQIATRMGDTGEDRATAIFELAQTRQPTRRIIEAEKVASLALYLCGDDASEVTGATMSMDGGWSVS